LDQATEAAPVAAPGPGEEQVAEQAADDEAGESGKREAAARGAHIAALAKQESAMLLEAQQLLHAQRYEEARAAFTKLLTVKKNRGVAFTALAKIAFQEKNYSEAVERAKESARAGGGAEARVLLGDAYFKLEKYEDAKKAYGEALKLDPNNRVASQGLRLLDNH
jgi:tetratricopeptide (TPR) repeat protein